jgi:hypothetical protein
MPVDPPGQHVEAAGVDLSPAVEAAAERGDALAVDGDVAALLAVRADHSPAADDEIVAQRS